MALFRDRDYDAAIVAFRRAYELSPHPVVIFNIGLAQIEQHDYVGARASLQEFISQTSRDEDPERVDHANRELDRLVERIGAVSFQASGGDVEVRVNGDTVGRTPLDSTFINSGRHRVEAFLEGRLVDSQRIEIVGGESITVSFTVPEELATTSNGLFTARSGAEDHSSTLSFPWWAWITTGALAAGSATMITFAVLSQATLDDELATVPGNRAAIEDAKTNTDTYALMADILLGTTVVMATVSIVLTVLSLDGVESQENEGEQLSLRWGLGGVALEL